MHVDEQSDDRGRLTHRGNGLSPSNPERSVQSNQRMQTNLHHLGVNQLIEFPNEEDENNFILHNFDESENVSKNMVSNQINCNNEMIDSDETEEDFNDQTDDSLTSNALFYSDMEDDSHESQDQVVISTNLNHKEKEKKKFFVNRDRNAALNILYVGKEIALGNGRPQLFCH